MVASEKILSLALLWRSGPIHFALLYIIIVLFSSSKTSGFPRLHKFSQLARCSVCSFAFDLDWGFGVVVLQGFIQDFLPKGKLDWVRRREYMSGRYPEVSSLYKTLQELLTA